MISSPKLLRKICGKTCHELLQQADSRRLLLVKQAANGSWFINEFFVKLALFNIHDTFKAGNDHPTSSSSSLTSPTMTSSTVSSESVARWARRDTCEGHFVHSYPVVSKTWCGEMLIRTVNKFSLSLSPSASDSPGNAKSESQKVPLSSWTEQQPRTERLVMFACSSNSSEWNDDDKWSSQVRRTGVHPI